MILTEKEKKLIDKFYLKMNLGTDSKLLIIEKITENAIYYSFLGYNYIFDSETETGQQILTNKELTEKIIEIIPFWEQDENSKKDTFKMLQSNDIKQIKHIIDFLQDYDAPKIIEQLQKKIDKIKKTENFDKIKIVVNQDNIKDYDTLNTITEKELKTRYNDLKIVSNHFLENIFIINNKKYKISKNSNFKIIELEETTENF